MKVPFIDPITLTKIFVEIPDGYCLKLSGSFTIGDKYWHFFKDEFIECNKESYGKDTNDFYIVITPYPY